MLSNSKSEQPVPANCSSSSSPLNAGRL